LDCKLLKLKLTVLCESVYLCYCRIICRLYRHRSLDCYYCW